MSGNPGAAVPTKKDHKKRAKVQFKVVQQSYEDKDYEDAPKPVLVPAALADQRFKKRRNHQHPSFVFAEDLPEDYSNKRNMLMADDTRPGEEHLFDGEVEEEFDENFIHQMMYGEVDEEDEDLFGDEDEEGMEEYPEHNPSEMNRAIDKQYSKMMREFDVDEDINDAEVDDPRTHGPLEVDQYMTALEEFVEDKAGYDMDTAEPKKNKGLLNQLKMLSHRNRIFDANNEGVFVTTLLPDKASRFMAEFKRETDEIRAKARDAVEASKQRTAEQVAVGLAMEEEEEAPEAVPTDTNVTQGTSASAADYDVVELVQKERFDCETVLSTYSTLYNHPNVIAAARKKMNPNKAMAMERKRQHEERVAKMASQHKNHEDDINEESDEESADDEDGALARANELGLDLSVRPKDESAEEKKLRRQLVKQLQREKRQQKKELKTVYRDTSITTTANALVSKQARAQASLSMGKRI
jgi:protein LTV1